MQLSSSHIADGRSDFEPENLQNSQLTTAANTFKYYLNEWNIIMLNFNLNTFQCHSALSRGLDTMAF